MPIPLVRVQIGFDTNPDADPQLWTTLPDEDVRAEMGISFNGGRTDELTEPSPGRLQLVLSNDAGQYTTDNESSPYWPNVVPRKRIRLSLSVDGGDTWVAVFDGLLDGWPVAWVDGTATSTLVQIGASDRLIQLSSVRKLRDAVMEWWGSAADETTSPLG